MRRDERGCEIVRSPALSSKAEPRDLNVIAAFCIGEETQKFFCRIVISQSSLYRCARKISRFARNDDTRERAISHSLSFLHVEGCPCGADLSSAFGAPLLQGATPLACKSATPKRHSLPDGKSQRNENTAFPVSSFRAQREIFLAQRSNGERQMRSNRST